jgi:hypothetical protein
MEREQRNIVVGADLVGELPCRGHTDAFGAHDGDVEAVGDLRGFEQGVESFLFDEQQCTEIVLWSVEADAGSA